MSAIVILIICSLTVAIGFLIAFLISVRKGQFDDTYTPSVRMLFENELLTPKIDENVSEEQTALNIKPLNK
jgi:cbb3-type cytochrome oxidase maturation protein